MSEKFRYMGQRGAGRGRARNTLRRPSEAADSTAGGPFGRLRVALSTADPLGPRAHHRAPSRLSSEWDVRGKRLSRDVQSSVARRRWKFLFLVLVVVVLVVVVFAMPAIAEPISSLKPTGYVNDFAGVLGADTQSQLNEMCRQADQKAGTQIAVVTIKSTDAAVDQMLDSARPRSSEPCSMNRPTIQCE
jgi:hypothetical protein